jgi:transcriptional regulator of acetoin/glycerol metabolism
MSVIDRFGLRVSLEDRECEDPYESGIVERTRSLEMAARVRAGWPVGKVARYFGVHRTTVWRRVRSIHPAQAERTAGFVG